MSHHTPESTPAFTDPYQAPSADAQPAWLGGPDAVSGQAGAHSAAAHAAPAFQDPYQSAPAEASPAWLDGPPTLSPGDGDYIRTGLRLRTPPAGP